MEPYGDEWFFQSIIISDNNSLDVKPHDHVQLRLSMRLHIKAVVLSPIIMDYHYASDTNLAMYLVSAIIQEDTTLWMF